MIQFFGLAFTAIVWGTALLMWVFGAYILAILAGLLGLTVLMGTIFYRGE